MKIFLMLILSGCSSSAFNGKNYYTGYSRGCEGMLIKLLIEEDVNYVDKYEDYCKKFKR